MEGMVVFSLKREDLKISYNLKKEFLPYLHVPMALSFLGEGKTEALRKNPHGTEKRIKSKLSPHNYGIN